MLTADMSQSQGQSDLHFVAARKTNKLYNGYMLLYRHRWKVRYYSSGHTAGFYIYSAIWLTTMGQDQEKGCLDSSVKTDGTPRPNIRRSFFPILFCFPSISPLRISNPSLRAPRPITKCEVCLGEFGLGWVSVCIMQRTAETASSNGGRPFPSIAELGAACDEMERERC